MTPRAPEASTTDVVPVAGAPPSPAALRAARRAVAPRESAYLDEIQRLLDAGLSVMLEGDGSAGPRVADVVSRAGLSNQAFYRHFTSKDELVAAVVEEGAWRLVGYLEHQMSRVEEPEDKVRAWVNGVLSQASQPAVAHATRTVLWNMRRLPSGRARGARPSNMEELLVDPLRTAGSADPARDAATISAAVFGRLDNFLWEDPPTARDIQHVIEFCLAAIDRRERSR